MTREEHLAYGRGYNAGYRKRWPEHQPPQPPNEIIAELMQAATTLRNRVDGELAMFDPGDQIQERLGDGIDAVDEAMARVSKWLHEYGGEG